MNGIAVNPKATATLPSFHPESDDDRIWIRCPQCSGPLGPVRYDTLASEKLPLRCSACLFLLAQEDGIWNALPNNRCKYFEQFVREYEFVRQKEGRGSHDPGFYLALPYEDTTRLNSWQWKIRARSFRHLQQRILPKLRHASHGYLRCLDLGAGNGWLSYRLAEMGHRPVAVDLLSNSFDGLGATKYYRAVLPKPFPCFQAELDRLPFGESQFDCALFAASFHYSENYARTLGEAIRCVRPRGVVLIIDSPRYSREEYGKKMVQERHIQFKKLYGFCSDSLLSHEFLTNESLEALAQQFALKWKREQPWYGLRWALRPYVARWKGRREPARFSVYIGEVPAR
jgi:SAM-dependent methyltransferase